MLIAFHLRIGYPLWMKQKLPSRWTIIGTPQRRPPYNRSYVLCRCSCGTEREVCLTELKSGHTKSCGCLKKDAISLAKRTHGFSLKSATPLQTKAWNTWCKLRGRCLNPKDHKYPHYGGRGIKVCRRWDKFENFLVDMGLPPSGQHSVDRKNTNGDYAPNNCRWATALQQARNRRDRVWYTLKGERLLLVDLAVKFGFKLATLQKRLHMGWTIEQAISTPLKVNQFG